MKTKPTLLCLFVLAFFASSLPAQQPAPQQFDASKMHRSKTFREMRKESSKRFMKAQWSGKGSGMMIQGLLHIADFREALGVTEEQHRQIQKIAYTPDAEHMPELMEIGELMQSGKIFGDNPDPEAEKRYGEIQLKISEAIMERVPVALDEVLTEEQKRKAQEYQLATMSKSPFLPLDTLQIFDLSEAQKKDMQAIRKELEPQFNLLADEFSEYQFQQSEKIYAAMEKEGGYNPGSEDFSKRVQETVKRLHAEDPEFKKVSEEMAERGKAFSTQLKTKMFDVLTDEQWEKLQNLVDNPPEYVKKMRAALQKQSGQSQSAGNKADSRNFMDAWKPGDPIPEEYRKKRAKKAFPMAE